MWALLAGHSSGVPVEGPRAKPHAIAPTCCARIVCRRIARYYPVMRWLLHGQISASVAEALRRHEQSAMVAQADLTADQVFESARKQQLEVMTADATLTDSLFTHDAQFSRLIVHLNVEPGDVEQDDAVDRLFARYRRLTPGRLYTVTASRVKVRQLPTGKLSKS